MINLALPSSVPVDEGLAKFLVELTSGRTGSHRRHLRATLV